MKNIWIWVAVGYVLLRQRNAIGAIYNNVPELYECNDGTFSTSAGPRGCVRHGGKKTGQPLAFGRSSLLDIVDVPISYILTDTKLFQGREKNFSERSVENIVNDATSGNFRWSNFDPITLWRSPEGKLFIMSGHSRKEAFRRLAEMGIKIDGKGFDRIPAKIETAPLEVARTLALESNTLSTKENDIERAAYYRKLRQDGISEKEILTRVKKNEGRNWTNIYAYTYLSPTGRTWATLRQFADSEDTSATLTKSLAKWIGQAMRTFPLTAAHENELYEWLFLQKGYGTGGNQVSSEREFMEKVQYFVAKNTLFGEFKHQEPLNIYNTMLKSPAEQEFDKQILEQQTIIQTVEKSLKIKIKELADRKATLTDISRIVAPMEAQLRNARAELARLLQKKAQVIEYSKNEARLFGYRRR